MPQTNDVRLAMMQTIARLIEDYASGHTTYQAAEAILRDIFQAPTCRVAFEDVASYLSRILQMARAGVMSRDEATSNIVNMEASFDSASAVV